MCTTACVQVGMAILCSQIQLEDLESVGDTEMQQSVGSILDWCMEVSNVVHGRVEVILGSHRRSYSDAVHGTGSRMISVNELVRTLNIDLGVLGIGVDELVVCQRGACTPVCTRSVDHDAHEPSSGSRNWLTYEPECCYISLEHVPICMLLSSSDMNQSSSPCVGMVTANGHTVCVCCYSSGCIGNENQQQQPQYALFDPAPGRLQLGLSGAQMVQMLQGSLGIPGSAVRCTICPVIVASVSGEEGEGVQALDKKKRKKNASTSHDLHRISFYCDVTLFYIQKRHTAPAGA